MHGCTQNSAAVRALIFYGKWVLRQHSNGCEALILSAPPFLLPPSLTVTTAGGEEVSTVFLCHGERRALAAESCLPPTRVLQDWSTRYAPNAASVFVEKNLPACKFSFFVHESSKWLLRDIQGTSPLFRQKCARVQSLCLHLPPVCLSFTSLLFFTQCWHAALNTCDWFSHAYCVQLKM